MQTYTRLQGKNSIARSLISTINYWSAVKANINVKSNREESLAEKETFAKKLQKIATKRMRGLAEGEFSRKHDFKALHDDPFYRALKEGT